MVHWMVSAANRVTCVAGAAGCGRRDSCRRGTVTGRSKVRESPATRLHRPLRLRLPSSLSQRFLLRTLATWRVDCGCCCCCVARSSAPGLAA